MIANGLSPEIMKKVFPFSENMTYNTRNKKVLFEGYKIGYFWL